MTKTILILVAGIGFFWAAPAVAQDQPTQTDAQTSNQADEQSPGAASDDRPRGPRKRGGFGRSIYQHLSDEEKERAFQFITDYFPKVASELETLRTTNSVMFERKMNRIMHEIMRLMWSRDNDPPEVFDLRIREYKLELTVRRLTKEFYARDIEDARKEEIRKELEKTVNEAFDVNQERTKLEILQLSRRIEDLRSQVENREARRDEIVKRQVEMRLNRGKGRDRMKDGERPRHRSRNSWKEKEPPPPEQEESTP